jgi:hypothetical protein
MALNDVTSTIASKTIRDRTPTRSAKARTGGPVTVLALISRTARNANPSSETMTLGRIKTG